MNVRQASFALRVVQRRAGKAAILYRRRLTASGAERLDRIGAISPLGFTSGQSLLRSAIRASKGNKAQLDTGPFHPLDNDWGARVACYTLVASGLRNANRMHKAATNLQHSDGAEAAWWLGVMLSGKGKRAIRALRVLTEAVK